LNDNCIGYDEHHPNFANKHCRTQKLKFKISAALLPLSPISDTHRYNLKAFEKWLQILQLTVDSETASDVNKTKLLRPRPLGGLNF